MTRRYYQSKAAALADLTDADDLASAAYPFNGDRPTVIRIRSDDDAAGGFVCIIEDDGTSVSRKRFRTLAELETILSPESDDDPTYVDAVAAIVGRTKTAIIGLRPFAMRRDMA